MAKKLTAAQQAENAIKWIDRLTRYKKTTGTLEKDGKYCCLGVACKVLDVPYEYGDSWKPGLALVLGMNDDEGEFYGKDGERVELVHGKYCLTSVNDDVYRGDGGFTNMKKFIKNNIKYIFRPSVAKLVAKHYAG